MPSREMPEISEVFTCKTPELKKISIECVGKNVAAGAMLSMVLADGETGEVYFEEEKSAGEVLRSRIAKKVEMELKKRAVKGFKEQKTAPYMEASKWRFHCFSYYSESEKCNCGFF